MPKSRNRSVGANPDRPGISGLFSLLAVLGVCAGPYAASAPQPEGPGRPAATAATAQATFAGGCFWCMESPFFKVKGVIDVVPGYSGGETAHPTYEDVSGGATGHAESVNITYDPAKVSYAT